MFAMLKYPFLGHRSRMTAAAVSFMIIAQTFIILIGYNNAREVDQDIQKKTNDQYFTNMSQSVVTLFNDLNALMISLISPEFTKYTSYYSAYRDEVKARQERNDLNRRMNELHLQGSIVDKVYFLGGYGFQRSFVKSGGAEEWEDESIPSLYDLEKTDLLLPILLGSSTTAFFEKGSLRQRIKGPLPSVSVDQVLSANDFARQLEGRVVLGSGKMGGGTTAFMVLLTLQPDFMDLMLPNKGNDNGYITLLDANDQLIWTNVRNDSLVQEIKNGLVGRLEGKQAFDWKGIGYVSQFQSIGIYGFKLVYTVSAKSGNSAEENNLLKEYIQLSAFTLLVTFLISFIFSAYILLPFRRMSWRMKRQAPSFPLKLLSATLFSKRVFPQVPIRSKLLSLMIVAVLIPVGSVFIFYSQFLSSFSEQRMENSTELIFKQTLLSIRSNMDIYENLLNALSVNEELQSFLTDPGEMIGKGSVTVPNFSFVQYPRLADVSYFVLYDNAGKALYSSSNLNVSSLDTTIFQAGDDPSNILWFSNSVDAFYRPEISLIKHAPFFAQGSGAQRYSGYFKIVLKDSVFQSKGTGEDGQFVILDRTNKPVYQSSGRKSYSETAASISQSAEFSTPDIRLKQVDGSQYVMITERLTGTDWRVSFFQSMDSVLAKNKEIYYRFWLVIACLVLLIMLAAWLLSRLLVRPIEQLKTKMEEIGGGRLNERLHADTRDEIGELVQSFNQMIVQINGLMHENIQITEENAKNKLREQQLIALKTRAELNMLQQQINPHFLYNTLELINMRSLRYGATEVSAMVSALADIFRYSTKLDNEQVKLKTEIEHTRNYITIQEIRFRDKFTVEWSLSEEALSCEMLKFVLQPIVENTIKHGFTELSRPGKLFIGASVKEEMLVLEVRDNGIGMEQEDLEKLLRSLETANASDSPKMSEGKRQGSGVGLNIVYRRLSMFYNGKARMLLSSKPMQGMFVQIVIPQPKIRSNDMKPFQ